ncbi:MAG: disulfide bond formation protein B [Candidatus Nomurabacteria bacterium]|nr:disulfide bond formation protein B [Candidatus Nomurabacteria bacterium]
MNLNTIHYLNVFLGMGAILLQIVSVGALGMLFFGNKKHAFLEYIDKHFLILGFSISLFATAFSLVYSEAIGYAPCHLCWLQRIFIYPLVLMFGVALWDKDKKVLRYALPLIAVGTAISIYHNLRYYFGENGLTPCDSSGVSCYQQLVSEFNNYISIPMLALTGFFALITLCLVVHFRQKHIAK